MTCPVALRIDIGPEGKSRPSVMESVAGERVMVRSRSGLHATEKALIDALPRHPHARRLLLLGNRTGVTALVAAAEDRRRVIRMNCLDVHVARMIERNLKRNPAINIEVDCRPGVEERECCDLALLQLARGEMSGELVEDVLQQIHLALRPHGRCTVAVEGDPRRVAARMKALFGGCSVSTPGRSVAILESAKTAPLRKARNFEAEFEMTLPGGYVIRLLTLPGVFAHRRADEGALALAETADVRDGDSVLDLGCGCGAVGLALAAKAGLRHVTFVDSNVRATCVTRRNCERNGLINNDVQLSDTGPEGERTYTVFVGNPPYFGDFKIAGFFLRVAAERLAPGGRAYVVSKQGARIAELAGTAFERVEVIRRRGYDIVAAVKPDGSLARGR